jgi:hypothetical protein
MQFYGIYFMYPYKQTCRWQDVLDTVPVPRIEPEPPGWKPSTQYQAHSDIDQTAYTDVWKKYHKYACRSLLEDEHLDVQNMSKTLKLKH